MDCMSTLLRPSGCALWRLASTVHLCRSSCFPQKTKPRRLVTEVSLANDFQCHRTVKINIERFVGDAHCAPTQFDRFPVLVHHQFVVLKSLHRLFRCQAGRFLGSRILAALKRTTKTLPKHANRAEFHRSRKLVAATRAGALGLRAHTTLPPSVSKMCQARISRTLGLIETPGPLHPSGHLIFRKRDTLLQYIVPIAAIVQK
jgi:hypothetical protein